LDHVKKIAAKFVPQESIVDVTSFGAGNVNDTFLVVTEEFDRNAKRFVLQRINQQVFRQPQLISLNIRRLTEHARQRLVEDQRPVQAESQPFRVWCFPDIILTVDGQDYAVDEQGDFWRCQTFVEGAVTYPQILNSAHAQEAGYALGRFHNIVSDLDPAGLHDTLEGFHITPLYVESYDLSLKQTARELTKPDVQYAIDFVAMRRDWATVLEDAAARGELVPRAIHGDPKVDNILINTTTGQAVSIIDLDTVKPGLVQYDIGDCLRSCCNPLGEETEQLDAVYFDLALCSTILQGYLPIVQDFFLEADYQYLYDAVRLISFELGLRFFTDYLNGNVYFKAQDDEHNLRRALVQFRLTESIEAQEEQIRTLVDELRHKE